MIKAIAEDRGVAMPSFFGYLGLGGAADAPAARAGGPLRALICRRVVAQARASRHRPPARPVRLHVGGNCARPFDLKASPSRARARARETDRARRARSSARCRRCATGPEMKLTARGSARCSRADERECLLHAGDDALGAHDGDVRVRQQRRARSAYRRPAMNTSVPVSAIAQKRAGDAEAVVARASAAPRSTRPAPLPVEVGEFRPADAARATSARRAPAARSSAST